jgi:hypothetical protein
MTTFSEDALRNAHKHCIFHKKEILDSDVCGCFYCLSNYKPDEILEWIDEENPKEQTALCPKCNIDAVIGSASGYTVTDKAFLHAMSEYWF